MSRLENFFVRGVVLSGMALLGSSTAVDAEALKLPSAPPRWMQALQPQKGHRSTPGGSALDIRYGARATKAVASGHSMAGIRLASSGDSISAAAIASSNPNIIVNKTDGIDTGVTRAPGDVIDYIISITNAGSQEATDVEFNDTPDANTTLTGNTLLSPRAMRHAFNTVGNTTLTDTLATGVTDMDGVTADSALVYSLGTPEVQTVTVNGTAGTFTLTFNGQTTSSIAFNATASTVQAALNSLSSIGGVGGAVTVAKQNNIYAVAFLGSLSGVNVNEMTAAGSGGATVAIATVNNGSGTPTKGTATVQPNGSFTYTPNAGEEMTTDTFTYTVTDGDGLSSSGVVTVTIGELVWYLDAAYAGANGTENGTSLRPYNAFVDISGANGPDQTGDIIFVRERTGNYGGNLTLLNGQRLYGGGATLIVNGVTIHDSTGGNTTTATGSTNVNSITLGQNNTVAGFTLGTTSGSKIFGNNFGTANISTVTLEGSGQALNLTAGTLTGSGFDSITSTGGTNNIALTTVATTGTFALGSGALSGATQHAVNINGGSGSFTYSGTITNAGATYVDNFVTKSYRTVFITAKAGGSVTFSGDLNPAAAAAGVTVQNSAAGTAVTFSGAAKKISTSTTSAVTISGPNGAGAGTVDFTNGGLEITTTSGRGFECPESGGTVTVTGTNNTIATTSGTALYLLRTNIGANNLNFRSINVSAGADSLGNGVHLNITGTAGRLNITGDGSTNASGGTIIQAANGMAINISNAIATIKHVDARGSGAAGVDAGGLLAMSGANVTVDNVALNGVRTLNVLSSTLNGTFRDISSNTLASIASSGTPVQLNNVVGTFEVQGGEISSDTTAALISLTDGSVSFTWAGNLKRTGGSGNYFTHTPGSFTGPPFVGHTGTLAFNGNFSNTGTTGGGLNFNQTQGSYTFNGNVSLTNGIRINRANGTYHFGSSVAINNPAGEGLWIEAEYPNVTYNGSISLNGVGTYPVWLRGNGGTTNITGPVTSNMRGFEIKNLANGGAFNFTGSATLNTTTNPGVLLGGNTAANENDTGSTVTLAPSSMAITTTSGTGFSATGVAPTGGTVVVTGANNTITSTNATALSVVNVPIGATNLNFKSIASGNNDAGVDPANGIVLNNTGTSGGLTVTGTGAAGSGGVIQNTATSGLSITNARNISLSSMNLTNANSVDGGGAGSCDGSTNAGCNGAVKLNGVTDITLDRLALSGSAEQGINGINVTKLTLSNSTISGAGNEINESGIYLFGLFGTTAAGTANSITNSTVTGSGAGNHNVFIRNSTATNAAPGAPDRLLISGSSFVNPGSPTTPSDGITVSLRTTANFQTVVQNSTFSQATATNGTDGIQVDAGDSSTSDVSITTSSFTGWNQAPINLSSAGTGKQTFNVFSNPTISAGVGMGINVIANNSSTARGSITGNSNITSANANNNGVGISLEAGVAGRVIANVNSNTITNFAFGVYPKAREMGSAQLDLTLQNNSVTAGGNNAFAGLFAESGNGNGQGARVTMNLVSNNISKGSNPNAFIDYSLGMYTGSTFQLQGFAGNGTDPVAVQNFISSRDIGGATVDVTAGTTVNYTSGTATQPLMFMAGGVEASELKTSLSKDRSTPVAQSQPKLNGPGFFATLGSIAESTFTCLASWLPQPSVTVPQTISTQAQPQTVITSIKTAAMPVTVAAPVTKAVTQPGVLQQAELDTIIAAALNRWEAAGLSAQQMAVLKNINFDVKELASQYLAGSSAQQIDIDRDAAGNGWFIDATPGDDAEFGDAKSATRLYTDARSTPAGRIDLLTTVMHEMGHVLGLHDSYNSKDREDLMYGYATKGERRLPRINQAEGAVAGEVGITHFLLTPVTIGTLPAGTTVQVKFSATVNSPFASTTNTVSNQGSVTGKVGGTDFHNVTNDPDTVAADDATVTPITAAPVVTATKVDSLTGDVNNNGAVNAGDTIHYVVTVTNSGNQLADGVIFTDTPGTNTTLVVGTVTTTDGTITSGNSAGNTAIGVNIGSLDGSGGANSSATIEFDVTVNSNTPAGTATVSNQGTVTSSNHADVVTDDPGTGTAGDATSTTIVLNEAPTATNLTQTKTYTEGAATVALDDIVVSDTDNPETITATLTLADKTTGSLSTSGAATYTEGATTGVWTITGTITEVNTALAAVAFLPATDNDDDTTIETLIRDSSLEGPAAGTITLDVTGTPDAPVAVGDTYNTSEDTPLDSAAMALPPVLDNDTDVDGDTLTAVLVSNVSNGTLVLNSNGTFTYAPNANYNGTDSFTYKANDGGLDSNTVQVTFLIAAVNDAPTLNAIANPAAIAEDAGEQTVNLSGITAGPTDETETVTISATSNNTALIPNPTVGTLSAGATTLKYTPVANASGTAIITVTVDDGQASSNTIVRTFTVTVNAVNDAPTNLSLTATPSTLDEGSSVSLDGSFNDVDTADTYTVVIDWGDGSTDTTLNLGAGIKSFSGQSHTYTDNGDYTDNGRVTISVTVTDSGNATIDSTTNVQVFNVPPTATFSNGGPVSLGNTGTVSFTDQADASSDDVATGFRYAYDFNKDGDFNDAGEIGNGFYAGSSTQASVTVPAIYLNSIGNHTIRGWIIDDDGGSRGYDTVITVNEAASLIVNTTQDVVDATDGLRSLREAITTANSNADASTITFDLTGAGPHIVQLNSVLPNLSTPITITGPTDESVTVRGNGTGAFELLVVDTAKVVSIANLTLTNSSNAIANSGQLTLARSTIRGNGTGVLNGGTATLINSTLSGNGNALVNSATATLTNVTISSNSTGVDNRDVLNLKNSLVVGNSTNLDNTGTLNNNGNNILAGDARIGPLANNGGPTQTHSLLYGSPALNAGDDAAAPATDQRGLPRPVGVSDIGAFEVQTFYTITGYVRTSSLAPVPNVSVQVSTVSGAAGTPVLTDANGFYEVTGVPAGGYLVTPTKTGWSINPTSQSLVVSNGNRAANFIATRNAGTYSIAGRIATSDGQAAAGISVALTPTKGGVFNPVLTNSAGYYTFNGVPDGSYVVTPDKSGWSFAPASHNVTIAGSSVSGKNFLGMNGHKIIGRIMAPNGDAIAGVTVTRTGAGSTPVTTNSAGYYTFINVPNGSIMITPGKSGYVFTPSTKTVTMNSADILNQNFIGATGYSIIGRIATSNGTPIEGVSVQLDGGAIVTTNGAGYYTFTGVANGQHTVVPTKTGYTFMPAQRTVDVNNGNVAGQNFIGTGP